MIDVFHDSNSSFSRAANGELSTSWASIGSNNVRGPFLLINQIRDLEVEGEVRFKVRGITGIP